MFLDKIFSFRRKLYKKGPSDDELLKLFTVKYVNFKTLIESNSELLKIISDVEEKLQGHAVFGISYVNSMTVRVVFHVARMVKAFEDLSGRAYPVLTDILNNIHAVFKQDMDERRPPRSSELVLPYHGINRDLLEFVGGKNANLGEIFNRVRLPIPRGFAITTTAFDRFLQRNDLIDEIMRKKMELDVFDPEVVVRVSQEIQQLFMEAKVPSDVQDAIENAFDEMCRVNGAGRRDLRVAMRSSAIGEDSELSFAGQYLTVLNVPRENILYEYKRILASLFTPQAITYRLQMGVTFEDAAMSVACLEMIPARVSGVMYTRHPLNLTKDQIIINAVWGLGPYAVDGVVTPDSYTLSKDSPPQLLDAKTYPKKVRLVAKAEGYVTEDRVDEEALNQACLNPDQSMFLAEYGRLLEEHFGCPQDIEWAIKEDGEIVILQARPLRLDGPEGGRIQTTPVQGYPVLLEGGDIVCQGIGAGPAHIVRSSEDLLRFPEGGVLIAPTSSPQYVLVMQKAQAVLTDSGSITGHMASIAREFKVPAILNTLKATSLIREGMEITVDAYSGRVYQGRVPELLDLRPPKGAFMKGTPVYNILRKRSDLVVPLTLTDPKSPDFVPQKCKTVHDIMRLLHELSYLELFHISDLATDYGNVSFRLVAPIPLDLFVIDLGKGIVDEVRKPGKVTVDEITSVPFKALLAGMLHEDLRIREPRPVELSGLFSVMTEQMLSPVGERFGDRSYAIVSDAYLNFSSRVGYHYSILDTFCGTTSTKNHVNFQFKGGAADELRRNRRARLIQKVLEDLGFLVEVVADRVTGRIAKAEAEVIEEKLNQIGRLLQFTRQMDMLMNSEASIARLAESFMSGDYSLTRREKTTPTEGSAKG